MAKVVLLALLLTACGRFNFEDRADACVTGGACTPAAVCYAGIADCGQGCTRTEPRTGACPGGTCETGLCVGPAGAPFDHPAAGTMANFGAALDSDGTRIVVGSLGANAAYVLENQGGWHVVATLTSTWGPPGARFGTAVAIEGDRIVVGARGSRGPNMAPGAGGAIIIYERSAGTWTEVAQVAGPDLGEFGGAVDLDGGRILVAAPFANTVPMAYGTAYIVEHTGGGWSVTASFTQPPADQFGQHVELRGDRAFVGSLWDQGPLATECGAVWIFEREPSGQWTFASKLQPTDMRVRAFGQGFSVDGDRVAVGVPWFFDVDRNLGAVYVYTRNGTTWSEVGPIMLAAPKRDDYLGRGIWMRGDRILATSVDFTTLEAFVHVYRREPDSTWIEVGQRIDAGGGAVAGLSYAGIEIDLQMTGIGDAGIVGYPLRGYTSAMPAVQPGAVVFQDVTGL